MDTSSHTMESLFLQLGLDNSEQAIDAFIRSHSLEAGQPLDQAGFWNAAQAQFIRESLQQDADWAELVDQLAAQLRP